MSRNPPVFQLAETEVRRDAEGHLDLRLTSMAAACFDFRFASRGAAFALAWQLVKAGCRQGGRRA